MEKLREKKGKAECNFFKAMGFDYHYVENGNDIKSMVDAFNMVKDVARPTILHIHTLKGCGLTLAEENKEVFHWMMPGTIENFGKQVAQVENYTSLTAEYIKNKIKTDNRAIVINAGTPGVFGFTKEYREDLGAQYTDVGIAEEHAVAYSSALAKSGAKPIFTVMSSFVQRTYDQMSQDLCLNNSPITMLVYWGGLSGQDATHLCTFDIPLISNIPNMVYLSPTNKEEYLAMLEFAYNQNNYPVAIRVPNVELVSTGIPDTTDYSILNKFKVEEEGQKVAIIALGNFFGLGEEVKDKIANELGINATLINPRFTTGVDEELLESLKATHDVVITLEDGILDGGFGEKIARFYGDSSMKVLNFGGKKEFTDRIPLEELYERYHLTSELIVEDTSKLL